MIKIGDRLTVLHTVDGSTFTDLSFGAFDYLRDPVTVSKTVYIGYKKPINSPFFRVKTASLNAWSWQYYNGSWTSLDVFDRTKSLARDGHVQWERPDDEVVTTVNGKEMYWYRVTQTVTLAVELWGIGTIFSSEQDLEIEYPNITHSDLYPANETTHVKSLIAARDHILSEINASAWDLLRASEVTKASTALALYYIFINLSDDEGDRYESLADRYYSKYSATKGKILLTVDLNDNGKIDEGERKSSRNVRLSR